MNRTTADWLRIDADSVEQSARDADRVAPVAAPMLRAIAYGLRDLAAALSDGRVDPDHFRTAGPHARCENDGGCAVVIWDEAPGSSVPAVALCDECLYYSLPAIFRAEAEGLAHTPAHWHIHDGRPGFCKNPECWHEL